jgi:hypothetical protein
LPARQVRRVRVFLGLVLFSLAAAPVLHVMGCGARSELLSPGGGVGGQSGCVETEKAAVTASIGGGIHYIYTECMPRPDGGACPTMDEATESLELANCELLDEILCGPIEKAEQCCYVALEMCALT